MSVGWSQDCDQGCEVAGEDPACEFSFWILFLHSFLSGERERERDIYMQFPMFCLLFSLLWYRAGGLLLLLLLSSSSSCFESEIKQVDRTRRDRERGEEKRPQELAHNSCFFVFFFKKKKWEKTRTNQTHLIPGHIHHPRRRLHRRRRERDVSESDGAFLKIMMHISRRIRERRTEQNNKRTKQGFPEGFPEYEKGLWIIKLGGSIIKSLVVVVVMVVEDEMCDLVFPSSPFATGKLNCTCMRNTFYFFWP